MNDINTAAANLEKHNFTAKVCNTSAEAVDLALELIGTGSAGIGGSVTVKQLGLYDKLAAQGNEVHWHWAAEKEQKGTERRKALTTDFYLCSANALTESGMILNIDGTGNRVAATVFGPKNIIMIAGRNKIVDSIEDGLARIRRECCPANARRLNLRTPCALTGECTDCSSPDRMCNVFTVYERKPKGFENFFVILVNEDLGL